jgi:hypothetical protein
LMENGCALASGTYQTSFSIVSCHTPLWSIWMFMKPWPMLESGHFSCQARSFQEWYILCETKYCLISVMCASHRYHNTSCRRPHCLLLKPPLHALETQQQPIYQLFPLRAATFEGIPQPSDRDVCICCKKISVLRDRLFFS